MAKSIEELISSKNVEIPSVQNWIIKQDEIDVDYDKADDTLWVAFSDAARRGDYFFVKNGYYVIMVADGDTYAATGIYVENWYGHYLKDKMVKYFWNESGKTIKNIGGWDNTIPNLIEAILAVGAAKK